MDSKKVRYGQEIVYCDNGVSISLSDYGKSINQIVTKSFKHDSVSLWSFPVELYAYKLIEIKGGDKKGHFSELIGFIIGEENRHPFFGTIVIKYYSMGDLYEYAHEIKRKNDRLNKKFKSNNMKNQIEIEKEREEEIKIFLDLAKQIAEGKLK